jgi:hypothetical protein
MAAIPQRYLPRYRGHISPAECRAGDVTAANMADFASAHRIARESIEAISRLRQAPSLSVERSESIELVLIPHGQE